MTDDESTMTLGKLPEPAELRKRMEALGLGRPAPATPAPTPAPAPKPAPQPVRTSPYPWEGLERLDGRQVAMMNRLLSMLPGGLERGALARIEAELEALTGQVCMVQAHGIRLHPAPGASVAVGGAFVTLVELPPDADRGVLSVDLALVDAGLRAMLGEEDAPRHVGPLSGRDFGLVTYALLRGMAALSVDGDMAPLVFGSSAPSADEVRRALVCGLDVVECAFYVRMAGGGQGWVRLWLSAHLIKNLELFFMRGRLTGGELARLERAPCGQAPAQLQVIAGVVELGADVVASLGRGDVVFFDEHGVSPGSDEAPNRARLYTRGPGSPWVYARCRINEARRWEVVPCSALEHPRTTTAGSVQMAQEQAEGGIGAAMTQEIPVLVEVRLGAVTMPIAALTRLAQGQVLTLAQPVGSPVEVLAGGRVLALGELVSVEGRVGVRLTQVRGQ